MIKPNDTLANYEWAYTVTCGKITDTGIGHNVSHLVKMTWGLVYSAGVTGWLVSANSNTTIPGAGFSLSYVCPWAATVNSLAVAWKDTIRVKVEMDQARLVVNSDCTFSLVFSALRLYFDLDGLGWVLMLTVGAQSISGSGFDHRLNETVHSSVAELIGAGTLDTGCTDEDCRDIRILDDLVCESAGNLSGGWRWDYLDGTGLHSATVRIRTIIPPAVACECSAPLTGIGFSADYDSYHLSVSSVHRVSRIKSLQCVRTCTYSLGCTNEIETWYIDTEGLEQYAILGAVATTAPMRAHRRYGYALCDGASDSDTDDVSEIIAYSEYTLFGQKIDCRQTCDIIVEGEIPCAPGVDPDPPCPDPCFDEHTCHSIRTVVSSWPTAPPCAFTLGRTFLLQSVAGELMRSSVETNEIWFRYSYHSAPLPSWASEVLVTSFGDCVGSSFLIDPLTLRIELYIWRSNLEVWWCTSDDNGATFTTPILFMAAIKDLFGAAGQDGSRFLCWFEYDAGTSGPGKAKGQYRGPGDTAYSSTFTFVNSVGTALPIAEDGMSNVDMAFDSQARWSFAPMINGEAAASDWASFDDGRTWQRL